MAGQTPHHLFSLTVQGHPATQGSKKAFLRGSGKNKKIVLVEMDAKLPAWRQAIIDQARETLGPDWPPADGPLFVEAQIYLPRPKKSSFGEFPAGPPDLDKLQRAIGDALTHAKAIHDDARIIKWIAIKAWGTEHFPAGIEIHVSAAGDTK